MDIYKYDIDHASIGNKMCDRDLIVYSDVDIVGEDMIYLHGSLSSSIYLSSSLIDDLEGPKVLIKKYQQGDKIKFSIEPKSEKVVGIMYQVIENMAIKYNINI